MPPTDPPIAPPPHEPPPADAPKPDAGPEPADLATRLGALERQLADTRAKLDAADRRASIQRLLADAHAVDLEAGTLLIESALGAATAAPGAPAPDLSKAVADLKRRKPNFFRTPPTSPTAGAPASAMAGRIVPSPGAPLADAARAAAANGDRNSVLRYLRLRRAIA